MKARHLYPLALLLLLLAACTTPPITINLSDVALDFQGVGNTLGKVIFPKDPLTQSNPVPGTSIASLTIQGKARLKTAADITFEIYATDTDPSSLGCTPVGNYYVCDAGTNGVEKVGTIAFQNTAGPVNFQLSDKNQVLSKGVNNQSLYLGAGIGGTFSVNNVLYLEHLTATVQLNVGK